MDTIGPFFLFVISVPFGSAQGTAAPLRERRLRSGNGGSAQGTAADRTMAERSRSQTTAPQPLRLATCTAIAAYSFLRVLLLHPGDELGHLGMLAQLLQGIEFLS
jgi:hypothetical protein